MDEIENLELTISKFLRLGILIAGFFILVGWLMDFSLWENPFNHFQEYRRVPFMDLARVAWAQRDWPFFLTYLGLFILISLPVIRVFLTAILFVKQKEMILATIAGMVLFFLILSMSLGIEL